MKTKQVKVQISLPTEIVEKINEEIKGSYQSKSGWFLKIVKDYFDNKKTKTTIRLNY